MMDRLILASASPRPAEILADLGVEFEVITRPTDESLPDGIAADRAVAMLAERKACAVAEGYPDRTVLAADTVVAVDGRILGKPATADEAREMLRRLSARTHTVYTGVCIIKGGVRDVFVCSTEVEFYPLTDRLIERYIASGESMDKAGAYGVQGLGRVLVRRIEGDFFTVMGLPAAEVWRRLYPQ